MIHIVWDFLVRADRLPEFERYYSGVDGPWAQLFRKSPGFRGTVLLHDTQEQRHFLTIDSWDTVVAHKLQCASSSRVNMRSLIRLVRNSPRVNGGSESLRTKHAVSSP